jgi:hypothetical protein
MTPYERWKLKPGTERIRTICPIRLMADLWPQDAIYDKQRAVVKSVEEDDETYVKAGNKLGKDFIAGKICVTNFLRCLKLDISCRIVTHSVADHHLKVLWAEIGKAITTARIPLLERDGGPLILNDKEVRRASERGSKNANSYLVGLVSDKGEGLAGHHAEYTMFVGDEACFDSETEVLTEDGWKEFKDLSGEQLLTMDPMTRRAFYERPSAIHVSHRKGEMYGFKHRTIDFLVTPNHRMFYGYPSSNGRYGTTTVKWETKEIESITTSTMVIPRKLVNDADDVPYYMLPATEDRYGKFLPGVPLKMDDWVALYGWVLSEGSLARVNGKDYGVSISQTKPEGRKRVTNIISSLGFTPKVYQGVININDWRVSAEFAEMTTQTSRRVPRWVFKLSARQIKIFLDEYLRGDGYLKGSRRIIYTSSKGMADDLQELFILSGSYASIRERSIGDKWVDNHWICPTTNGYVVGDFLSDNAKVQRKNITRQPYDGMVYCATMPTTGLLYVRRGGTGYWSGNSGIDDVSYEMAQGWAKRMLIFGNPNACTNFYYKNIKGGDVVRPFTEDDLLRWERDNGVMV